MQSINNFLRLKMIKVCNIALSYLEENQKPSNDRLISIEKEFFFFFQLSIQSHVFFGTAPVTITKNLKS